jgi:uncharacterized protein (TIGR02118 family)
MIRFLVVYETPADAAAFDQHYRDVHIPLVKKLPGLRQYTISRNAIPVQGAEAFYLIAELDWDDMGSMQAAFATPEGQATAADVEVLMPGGGVRTMIFEVEAV